jgi:hypothetical protein
MTALTEDQIMNLVMFDQITVTTSNGRTINAFVMDPPLKTTKGTILINVKMQNGIGTILFESPCDEIFALEPV